MIIREPAKGLAVVACGGRDYQDWHAVFVALSAADPDVVIVGDAQGADALALGWAMRSGKRYSKRYADWNAYGKAAGPKRNAEMLTALFSYRDQGYEIAVIAFPGGRGTADMTGRATRAGVRVWNPVA